MTNILDNGIGGSTGATLATASPLYMSGNVWFVSSASGDASYSGKDRKVPLDGLAAAIGVAANDDIIVLLSDHAEVVSTPITADKRLTIIGEGLNSGKPTASMTQGHTTSNVITVTAANVTFDNILFKPHTSASTGKYIDTAVADMAVKNCYFEMDENSDAPSISLQSGADNCRISGCTFESTAETVNDLPVEAVTVAAAITGLTMEDCIFNGGIYGFETSGGDPWAFDGSAAAITSYRIHGLTLLNGSDFKLNTSSTGYVSMSSATQDGRLLT